MGIASISPSSPASSSLKSCGSRPGTAKESSDCNSASDSPVVWICSSLVVGGGAFLPGKASEINKIALF